MLKIKSPIVIDYTLPEAMDYSKGIETQKARIILHDDHLQWEERYKYVPSDSEEDMEQKPYYAIMGIYERAKCKGVVKTFRSKEECTYWAIHVIYSMDNNRCPEITVNNAKTAVEIFNAILKWLYPNFSPLK